MLSILPPIDGLVFAICDWLSSLRQTICAKPVHRCYPPPGLPAPKSGLMIRYCDEARKYLGMIPGSVFVRTKRRLGGKPVTAYEWHQFRYPDSPKSKQTGTAGDLTVVTNTTWSNEGTGFKYCGGQPSFKVFTTFAISDVYFLGQAHTQFMHLSALASSGMNLSYSRLCLSISPNINDSL